MNFDENLANLDPSERLQFDLNPLDSVEEQADKLDCKTPFSDYLANSTTHRSTDS